jgi:5-methyltetrahydrofolate--homocysteine methyltransferase
MKTVISSVSKEVWITDSGPTVLIGERINPSGRKTLAEALRSGSLDVIAKEAVAQVEAGADVLDVNVACPGVDEIAVLPRVLEKVMASVDVPLCIDFNHPGALREALKLYQGKPIVNSVTGEENSLNETLPLVKEYGAAVIGLTLDEKGIPKESNQRVAIAHKILQRAAAFGIPAEDVIIDCLALTVGADTHAGLVTLDAVRKVNTDLGVNQTLGASNISFGLPERHWINHTFLAMAVASGVTCPTVDAAKVRSAVLSIDLLLARDRFAQRYLRNIRRPNRQLKEESPS